MNCDSIARAYRWLEYLTFGPWLQRCRLHFLSAAAGCEQAVVLGDGDGRFTASLLRTYPALRVICIDSSAQMIKLTERRTRTVSGSRLCLIQGDARHCSFDPGIQLICTHFFLDCLTSNEITALAERLVRNTKGGCRWVLSEFQIPQKGVMRIIAETIVGLLYFGFRVLTGLRIQRLPNYRDALLAAGLRPLDRKEMLNGLLTSELWVC